MDTLLQYLRYAVRSVVKNPGFTGPVVLTLALGIGATTALFSVLDRALLRPLPGAEPEALVRVVTARPDGSVNHNLSYPKFVDLAERTQIFAGLGGHVGYDMSLATAGGVERIAGSGVSHSFFATLGVRLALGRAFLPEEDRPGSPAPVAVLSHALWRRRFESDPRVVGSSVTLNGRPFTVVGVANPDFVGLTRGAATEAWVPLAIAGTIASPEFATRRTVSWLDVLGRLAPGVDSARATAGLAVLDRQLAAEGLQPAGDRTQVLDGSRGLLSLVGVLERPLQVVLAAVLAVLLIGCGNVAGLLLARAGARRREIAIRVSVGAGRGRLVRQLLTESLVLAVLGGAAGLLVAIWLSDLMPALPTLFGDPLRIPGGLDRRIVTFAGALTLGAATVFGLAPAVWATRVDLVANLKEGAGRSDRGSARAGLRDALVVLQIALSLVLLATAGLFLRTLTTLAGVDPGYQPRNVLLASYDLDARGYDRRRALDFHEALMARLEGMPAVERASWALTVTPSPGGSNWSGVPLEAYTPAEGEEVSFDVNRVGTAYFETMRVPMVRGRGFGPGDRAGASRVAVINEAMARRYWPGRDPLGLRVWLGADTSAPAVEIVGVARDGKYRSLREEPLPNLYLSAAQSPITTGTLVIRTRGEPLALAEAVRREVRALDSELPLYGVTTLDEHLARAYARERLVASLAGTLGALAVVLAAVGLFGLLAYGVVRRTREIGVRVALGADRRSVIGLVVREGLARSVAGVALGVTGAVAVLRVVRSLLFGVSPAEPLNLGASAAVLLAVALLASWLPARRAAAVDPMVALRAE